LYEQEFVRPHLPMLRLIRSGSTSVINLVRDNWVTGDNHALFMRPRGAQAISAYNTRLRAQLQHKVPFLVGVCAAPVATSSDVLILFF
jgi:hypothetical protein